TLHDDFAFEIIKEQYPWIMAGILVEYLADAKPGFHHFTGVVSQPAFKFAVDVDHTAVAVGDQDAAAEMIQGLFQQGKRGFVIIICTHGLFLVALLHIIAPADNKISLGTRDDIDGRYNSYGLAALASKCKDDVIAFILPQDRKNFVS